MLCYILRTVYLCSHRNKTFWSGNQSLSSGKIAFETGEVQPHTHKTSNKRCWEKWFHTRDNHPPICLSAWGQSEGVGKDGVYLGSIPGSIWVVIHSTCAPHISGCWRTDGRQGSRCCSFMMSLKKIQEGGRFVISELFSVIAVIHDDTVVTRSLSSTAECADAWPLR